MNAIIVSVILLCSPNLFADTVRMKNGDVYRGNIIENVKNKHIQIQFKDGNEKRLLWKNIKSVKKEKVAQAVNDSGALGGKGDTFIIVGGIIWGVTYIGTVAASIAYESSALNYIPIVGPVVAMADETKSEGFVILSIMSTAVQTTGAALMVAGLIMNMQSQAHTGAFKVYANNDISAYVAPIAGPNQVGLGAQIRF